MVVAAHPLAAEAGLRMLESGGNAVDAAIATAFALNACEPFASGIGGGGFMVISLATERKVTAINFREMAPSQTSPDIFDEEGNIKTAGLAVAVPGALAGWTLALEKYGTKSLADVTRRAIEIAEEGFPVSQTFSLISKDEYEKLLQNAGEQACYLNQGFPYEPGELFRNPELASTFRTIAASGIAAFYKGKIARTIVQAVREKGGMMTPEDLENYEAREVPPLKGTYKDYVLYTLPPPGSGGLHLIQLLNIIENWPVRQWAFLSPLYIHHFCEALRFVFADRDRYLGDPDFVSIPVEELICKTYAAQVAARIRADRSLGFYPFGRFEEKEKKSGNTTHLSVRDEDGNIVALTQTINHFFGSGIIPQGTGFLLNNEMDDFTRDPHSPNAARPKRQPLSSMAPLIMFKKDSPFLVLGSPGGTRIFSSMAQVILNIIEFGMSLDEAIEAPRFFSYSSRGKARSLVLESRIPETTVNSLKKMGHEVKIRGAYDNYFGGAQGILIPPGQKRIIGGADSRRDGYGAGY